MTGNSSYPGIDVESPEWIGNLDASADADKLFVVAAFDEEATDAWVSLHEKQSDGSWHMKYVMQNVDENTVVLNMYFFSLTKV